MEKKKNKIKSACCRAEIRYSDFTPDFIGDNPKTMTIGTCCCICSKCNKSCNIYIPIRKTWTRNPKTQILEDNRKKQKKLFTDKELKEFRKEEDF
jgi:L-lactate utilization protein LutB